MRQEIFEREMSSGVGCSPSAVRMYVPKRFAFFGFRLPKKIKLGGNFKAESENMNLLTKLDFPLGKHTPTILYTRTISLTTRTNNEK